MSTADAWLEDLSSRHWLTFKSIDDRMQVVGCHCGFEADLDSDCGWGDSVVSHLFRVAHNEPDPQTSALPSGGG